MTSSLPGQDSTEALLTSRTPVRAGRNLKVLSVVRNQHQREVPSTLTGGFGTLVWLCLLVLILAYGAICKQAVELLVEARQRGIQW